IVLDKGDPPCKFRGKRISVYPLQDLFPFGVIRVGLSGKDDLDRQPPVRHDPFQTVGIMEDQVSSLVARKSACKTDRKHGWIEHQAISDKVQRFFQVRSPSLPFPLSDAVEQLCLEPDVEAPEFLIRDLVNHFPKGGIVMFL